MQSCLSELTEHHTYFAFSRLMDHFVHIGVQTTVSVSFWGISHTAYLRHIRISAFFSRWSSHRRLVNCWQQTMADSWFAVYLFLFLFSYSSEDVTDCPGEISFAFFPFEFFFSFGNRIHQAKIHKAGNFVASIGGFNCDVLRNSPSRS